MRNLTIKRTKRCVGCLAKMKVYLEAPESGEITINNVPCRKLGDLKNGEEKTFQIGDQAAKVFVIADTLSKNYCNDYYQLPEGQDDVVLSGKNKYNPAGGNPFQFDNNDSEDVRANRKKGTHKGLIVLIAAIVIGGIVGWFIATNAAKPKEKSFTSDGMTITLTDAFEEMDAEGFTVAYESKNVAVFALKEEFAILDGFESYSVKAYAELLIAANELDSVEIKTTGDQTYFVYDAQNPETKETYRYFSYAYKANDAFWCVQFSTLKRNADDYAEQIAKWAESVRFAQ